MGIGPEQQIVNEQYVQLLTRQSFVSGPTNVNCAATAISQPSLTGVNVPIPAGQAIRIVRLSAAVWDGNNTGKLTLNSAWVQVLIQQGAISVDALMISPPSPLQYVMTSRGIAWYFSDQELILYSDYQEQGGIPPGLAFVLESTVTNSDTAIHPCTMTLQFLIERYLLKPQGHLGFP